eukprot:s366_g24.t1
MKQNFGTGQVSVAGSDWFQPERGHKGYYLQNLFEYNLPEETYVVDCFYEEVLNTVEDGRALIDEERHTEWSIEPLLDSEVHDIKTTVSCGEMETKVGQAMAMADYAVQRSFAKRELKFWEVYVDEGRLAQHLATNYADVVSSTFSLPEWDFRVPAVRQKFLKLLAIEKPHFIWFAPPCTKWSPVQRMNVRCIEDKEKLNMDRDAEEKCHLGLVADGFEECKAINAGAAMEHPDPAESWRTKTMENVRGYYESKVNRCCTGLVYERQGEVIGGVCKKTGIRTTSKPAALAMDLPCLCSKKHVQMIGKSSAFKEMQNYMSLGLSSKPPVRFTKTWRRDGDSAR